MTRSVFRYVSWTMAPHLSPGEPEMLHELECSSCLASSGTEADFEAARAWAFSHTGGHPSHRTYREVVVRLWRMAPVRG
ncbi:DUF7848 domain-containing protein [Streptomyces sp. GSL17-111]|uniref:DUF7848 domain-containing protein n=1 Tax=Streptomyces sp. GSL17-111 TaxID=3121596 RepID=UPI004040929D